jgi:hypothetical protein
MDKKPQKSHACWVVILPSGIGLTFLLICIAFTWESEKSLATSRCHMIGKWRGPMVVCVFFVWRDILVRIVEWASHSPGRLVLCHRRRFFCLREVSGDSGAPWNTYCCHLKLVESLMSVPQQVDQYSLYMVFKRLLQVTLERQRL